MYVGFSEYSFASSSIIVFLDSKSMLPNAPATKVGTEESNRVTSVRSNQLHMFTANVFVAFNFHAGELIGSMQVVRFSTGNENRTNRTLHNFGKLCGQTL